MQKALADLKKQVCDIKAPKPISDEMWQNFADNTVVALMAGGESSRFREVPNSQNHNKNAYKLPNGDSMIEMTIRMYRDAGIKNFVALVYHKSETIIDLLGDGSSMGVNITYSHDPKKPVGKGGAVLNALLNKSIAEDKNLIVHNPDDVILNFNGSFPRHIASGHLEGIANGNLATVVVVEETPYTYSGMKIQNNKVTQIEMYPMIPLPTHIGVTIFDPKTYSYFKKLFSLTEKTDFEKVLFPVLSNEHKLYSVSIPNDNWLAVNNLKAYNQLIDMLQGSTRRRVEP